MFEFFAQREIIPFSLIAQGYCGFSAPMTKTQQFVLKRRLSPSFTLTNSLGCAPLTVTTTNTTIETDSCTPPTYLWTVTYAAANCGTAITIPNLNDKLDLFCSQYNFTNPVFIRLD